MITRTEIRAFRLALGWTRRELAEAIPVCVKTIKRWEAELHPPSPLAEARLRVLMREHPRAAGQAAEAKPLPIRYGDARTAARGSTQRTA